MVNYSIKGKPVRIFIFAILMLAVVLLFPYMNTGKEFVPPYSRLYQELLEWEEQGELEKSLALIPVIYGKEVPVQAFYNTLDNKRTQLMNRLEEKGSFVVGKTRYRFNDLQQIFTMGEINKPDVCYYRTTINNDLPMERFFFYMVVEGKEGEGAIPRVDPAASIQEPDPWLVSTALFLARKRGDVKLPLPLLIRRWEDRPDLWDSICTQQALLFLAKQSPGTLKDLKIQNPDIEMKVKRLKHIDPGECLVKPLFFYFATGKCAGPASPKSINLLMIERAGEREIDLSSSKGGIVSLRPGQYRFRYVSNRQYGSSSIFEAKQGVLIRVPLGIKSGV
jgi:hypothetical protein